MGIEKNCVACDGTGKGTDHITWKRTDEPCNSCDGSGFDTRWTDDVVCPWCGYKETDSFELNSDSHFSCGSCGKISELSVDMSVTYTTTKVPCLNDPTLHQWKTNTWYEPHVRGDKTYSTCTRCNTREWINTTQSNPATSGQE